MEKIRVMQSFGHPRPTTNPYIVMLRDTLVAEPGVQHVPFSWVEALRGRFDVFHVHWGDTLLAGRTFWTRAAKRAAFTLLLLRLRTRRIAVVHTLHNVVPPSGTRIDRLLVAALDRRADLHIHLSATTPPSAVPHVEIPHGHYRGWYASLPQRTSISGRLGYVGLIKPYKGLDDLISAFASASLDDDRCSLRIAGKPSDPAIAAEIDEAARNLRGLETTLRYVDDSEFVDVITESELVVLPYRHMHNSGTALAVLSLDRPVLVPDNLTTRTLSAEVGEGWVRFFTGALDAPQLMAARTPMPAGRPDLSAREWHDAGAQHVAAYRRALRLRRAAESGRRGIGARGIRG